MRSCKSRTGLTVKENVKIKRYYKGQVPRNVLNKKGSFLKLYYLFLRGILVYNQSDEIRETSWSDWKPESSRSNRS